MKNGTLLGLLALAGFAWYVSRMPKIGDTLVPGGLKDAPPKVNANGNSSILSCMAIGWCGDQKFGKPRPPLVPQNLPPGVYIR